MKSGDDGGAFGVFYRQHRAPVMRYACALAGNVADGEDLLQEAFLGFLRGLDRFEVGRPALPYLLTSVRNRYRDRKKRFAERGQRLDQVPAGRVSTEPGDPLVEAERHIEIWAALRQLSGEQAEILRLRVFAEVGYAEIATQLGIPPATVRSRYRAACARLKEQLAGKVGHDGP